MGKTVFLRGVCVAAALAALNPPAILNSRPLFSVAARSSGLIFSATLRYSRQRGR